MVDADNVHRLAVPEEDILILSGKVVAENVSYEDYLTGKFGKHTEWVYGVVVAMSPVSIQHDQLGHFLRTLLEVYLDATTGGLVFQDPVVMKASADLPGRQPDIQVILPDRAHYVQENQVAGPANLVVEIVSPESVDRDRGTKFQEYEKGGVAEYWILDPARKEALFYVHGDDGLFNSRLPVDGVYNSRILPKLFLKVSLLWNDKLPATRQVVKMVEKMVGEA